MAVVCAPQLVLLLGPCCGPSGLPGADLDAWLLAKRAKRQRSDCRQITHHDRPTSLISPEEWFLIAITAYLPKTFLWAWMQNFEHTMSSAG